MMRKVKFNRYIKAEYNSTGQNNPVMKGTGEVQNDYPNEGMFLGWGTASNIIGAEIRSIHTMALVELKDGTVEEVLPERIKFVNPSFIETKISPVEFKKQYSQEPEQPKGVWMKQTKEQLSRGNLAPTLGVSITKDEFYELLEVLVLNVRKIGYATMVKYINVSLTTRVVSREEDIHGTF